MPDRLQPARELDRLLERPAALDPVGRRDADEDRKRGGPGLAQRPGHGQREAHAILEAPAELIVAMVGQRREELVQEVAVRGVQFDHVEARSPRTCGGLRESIHQSCDLVGASGRAASGSRPRTGWRSARRASIRPRPARARRPRSHGAAVEALRPACASWMPAAAPCSLTNRTMRASGSMCASDQMPTSRGEMRPSGVTPVASTITRPAPPTARLPRCTRCQSVGNPSVARVLAHGRNEDPVAELEATKRERREEVRLSRHAPW